MRYYQFILGWAYDVGRYAESVPMDNMEATLISLLCGPTSEVRFYLRIADIF